MIEEDCGVIVLVTEMAVDVMGAGAFNFLGRLAPQQAHLAALSSLLTQQSSHFHFDDELNPVDLGVSELATCDTDIFSQFAHFSF